MLRAQPIQVEKIPLRKKYAQEDIFLNALAEAYRLQESIISTTELSIISTNTAGTITSFNSAAEKLTGYTADEVVGKTTPVFLHDHAQILERADALSTELGVDVEPNFEVFAIKARLRKKADRKEWTYIRKDSTRFPVLVSTTGLWDDNNHLIGYASIATDITELRVAAQKIKESELHLQALLNSIDDIAIEVSRDGVYTNIWTKNESLLFVTPRAEYVGKRLEQVLSGDVLKQHKQAIAKVLKTQRSEYIECLVGPGDRWSSSKISYINSDKVLVLIRNITEKKKAELLLSQSEQKFRTLATNIPGVIYLRKHDDNQTILYLNDRIKEITGYDAEEFISGKITFAQLYHPDDAESINRNVARALEKGKKFHLKYRILHESGEWRWVDEVGVGVDDPTVNMVEGFISDITLMKHAEEELQKVAEENYRLFNNAVTLNVIAGYDCHFKKVNPVWTELLGWEEEELKGKSFFDFVHPDDAGPTQDAVSFMQSGNRLLSFENRYRCKDGTYRWLLWGSGVDAKNKLFYAAAVDITERKKSEEELLRSKQSLEALALKLQEQNRQLDEFAHIISHNLRSPIGNIKALISLLDSGSSIAEYQHIFEKLKKVSNNLGETMNDLMETLKVKKETSVERVDIRFKEIFDKVVQSLEGELIQTEAHITFDFNPAPVINYSRAYLESIFQNLLNNAIKYRSPSRKPAIHVTTFIEGESLMLRVTDNGLGIDMEKFGDKLFGLHKTFHEHKDARGVGLFLVKTQIEALGGCIVAESELDKGTTFTIRF